MQKLKATILLLHYGDHERTTATLNALLTEANECGASITVIDNSPEDNPYPDSPGYAVLPNPANPPLWDSFLFGMPKKLLTPVLIFWGNSNVPHEGCLAYLLRAFDEDPKIGVAAPSTNDLSGVLRGYEPDFR